MNRRGFIGLLTAMIAIPLTKVFGKKKKRKRKINLLLTPEALLEHWNKGGSPLGEWCTCPEKIYLQKEDEAFKAEVTYCSNHGYTTSCYICHLDRPKLVGSTETCNRNHKAVDVLISAPKAYGVTPDNFRPQLTPITLAQAGQLSLDRLVRSIIKDLL